jgi:hypothetical protein
MSEVSLRISSQIVVILTASERVFGRFRRINEPDCKAVTLYANIDVRREAAVHVEAAADNIS